MSIRLVPRRIRLPASSAHSWIPTASWIHPPTSLGRSPSRHLSSSKSFAAKPKLTSCRSIKAQAVIRQDKKRSVTVTFPSGETTDFHHIWLRDHCRESRSYHAATKQRLVDTAKIPSGITPDHVRASEEGIEVSWPAESFDSLPPYKSFYPYAFLLENSYDPPLSTRPHGASSLEKIHWTSAIAQSVPTVEYDRVISSEEGAYEWVKLIDVYGFAFVKGIPKTPEATEALVRRIAFIRETHYGGFWDFTADLKHGDLAYSDQELRGHTDTTYFTDPCGLQLFHLLSPASSHQGGHNLLIDGFRAASLFKLSHPSLYHLFSTLPIPTHASGSGSSSSPSGVFMRPLQPSPVFTHNVQGELVQVRWNSDDRATVGGAAWEDKMEEWFEAVRVWEEILRSEEATLWSVMESGTAVIFDNLRVLHGRSAFVGERRLCGAYIAGDDYRSRLMGLTKQFGGKDIAREEELKRFGIELGKREGRIKSQQVWSDYL